MRLDDENALTESATKNSISFSSWILLAILRFQIFDSICVVGGWFAICRGDTDSDMLSIIVGLIIAGAPVTQAEFCERVWQRDHESAGARLRSSLSGCAEK